MNTPVRAASTLPVYARVALIALTAMLGACATADDGPYAWSKGWRKGEVLQVARPAELERPRFFKCVRDASPREAEAKFLVVKYLERGRAKRTAARAPAGDEFHPGDLVFVNLGDCNLAPARRQMSPRPAASPPKAG